MTPRLPGDIVTISANLSGHGFPIGTPVIITAIDDYSYTAQDNFGAYYAIYEGDIEGTDTISTYNDTDPDFNDERGYNLSEGE